MTIAYINAVSKFNNAKGKPYINIRFDKYVEPPDCRLSRSNFCVFCGPARNAYMIPDLLASMKDFQTGGYSKIIISSTAYNAYTDIRDMFAVAINSNPQQYRIGDAPCAVVAQPPVVQNLKYITHPDGTLISFNLSDDAIVKIVWGPKLTETKTLSKGGHSFIHNLGAGSHEICVDVV